MNDESRTDILAAMPNERDPRLPTASTVRKAFAEVEKRLRETLRKTENLSSAITGAPPGSATLPPVTTLEETLGLWGAYAHQAVALSRIIETIDAELERIRVSLQ